MSPSQAPGRHTLTAVMCAFAILGGCDAIAPSPTTTPLPPEAPTIRFASDHAYIANNGVWTYYANVDPGGSLTDVVLETGSGTEESPVFGGSIPVEEGMLNAGQVTAVVEYPEDAAFCVRFTATNALGTASTEPSCHGAIDLPVRTISPSG